MCTYEIRYPSTASYTDTLTLKLSNMKNVIVHVAVKRLGQSITNDDLKDSLYKFSQYETDLNFLEVEYPLTYLVILEPSDSN